MLSFATSLETILLLSVSASLLHVDSTRSLKRNTGDGVAYAIFDAHEFRYLNLTTLMSSSVKKLGECGKLCVDHSSCFSANLAAFADQDGWILCQLLPSDRYNNSEKFLENEVSHHLSIKASRFLLHWRMKLLLLLLPLLLGGLLWFCCCCC